MKSYLLRGYMVLFVLSFLLLLVSCEPKFPKYPSTYTSEQLKYHPKDANGVPDGYAPLYSRSGINSVDYVKISDLEKYQKKLKAYEDYKREKVLKDEYKNRQ